MLAETRTRHTAEASAPDAVPLGKRLLYYVTPFDARYEDLFKGNLKLNIFRDIMAGLIVAMVAIPLAMGFAMASGLRPEQGIVGGAVAGLIGALFGGSKYQVYGPTAAFIPVIGALMAVYNHSMLVLASILAGVILMVFGVGRLGRYVAMVPHSIVVGFTIGIALTIALSQAPEVFGIEAKSGYAAADKVRVILENTSQINFYSVVLGLLTFLITKYVLKISPFIPAPLLAIGVTSLIAALVWPDKNLVLISDHYGKIPTDFLVFTLPAPLPMTGKALFDLTYFVAALVFVAAVESLLCSRMADRLADNKGTPYNPNKELWGQGLVQIVVPLLNGFPHTGALARTATNIKVGAISPLAGIMKCFLKLTLAAFLAQYLELVPMACIGGILLFISTAMVKPAEIREVLRHNGFHIFLMVYTAVMVVVLDFLNGVLSATIIWVVLHRFFDKPAAVAEPSHARA
jgi:sulfate permease, SulP family